MVIVLFEHSFYLLITHGSTCCFHFCSLYFHFTCLVYSPKWLSISTFHRLSRSTSLFEFLYPHSLFTFCPPVHSTFFIHFISLFFFTFSLHFLIMFSLHFLTPFSLFTLSLHFLTFSLHFLHILILLSYFIFSIFSLYFLLYLIKLRLRYKKS